MTPIEIILSISNSILVLIIGLLLKNYFPAYIKAKGKNLASKEDISEITKKMERVRASITQESALLEKRRQVYERTTDAMRVFISGHGALEEQKEAFHKAYAACWLWASDSLIEKLNVFLELQKDIVINPQSHSQEELKAAYGSVILEMRKDAGFSKTDLTEQGFAFVRF